LIRDTVMPIIRSNHLSRARFERRMADLSATKIERIIHNRPADLHREAGEARSADAVGGEAGI
jgi:hypothetical protein